MSRQKPPDHTLSRADMDRIIKRQYAELARLRAENERLRAALEEVHAETVLFDKRFEITGEMGTETIAKIGSIAEEALAEEEKDDGTKTT